MAEKNFAFGLARTQKRFESDLTADKERQKNIGKEIVETAGFVPLAVRFQRLQESGQLVQLHAQQFDSYDMQKLYMSDEYRIEPEDELEEIQEKLERRRAYINQILEQNKNDETKKTVKNADVVASTLEKSEPQGDEVIE